MKDYHLKVNNPGPFEGRDIFVCATHREDAEAQAAKQISPNAGIVIVGIQHIHACRHKKGRVV